jgi:hypothetical protein
MRCALAVVRVTTDNTGITEEAFTRGLGWEP